MQGIIGGLAAALMSVAVVASPAAASEWRLSADTDNFVSGVDMSRVREVGGKKQIWTIKSYREREEGVAYTLSLVEYDCRAQNYTTIRFVQYADDGIVLYQSPNQNDAVRAVVPESVTEKWFEAACFDGGKGNVTFESAEAFHRAIQSYYKSGQ